VGSAGRQRSPAPGVYRQYFARSAHAADLAAGLSGNPVAEIRHPDAAGAPAVSRHRAAPGTKVRHLSQQLFELARLEHGGIKPQRERFAMGS
jgi:hypothetical protein